ncbi:5-formyltetrahydrofolate cyclo-ligase [Thiobacter aerophilum]|uniref:5-formyltetrahydrofolate cyclo-ligase n=1 Tax=Thiobacter aerophilum TaxID=3121275 RepID=A0ABV0ECR6_9BURK
MDKALLRREMRARRKAVNMHEARAAARRLLRVALEHRLLTKARRIGFYLPMAEEIDVLPLLNRALWLERECYLPVVPRRGAAALWFSQLTPLPTWYQNRFGIHEHASPKRVRARELDLLFLPLVAFDREGNRLGMGGGFYDATLAYLRHRRLWRRPRVIGVAYDFQRVDRLPREPWDVPLDAVLTDRGLHRFPR